MATSDVHVMAKRVKGGSFLTEERDPQDVFTPEDLSEEHRQIAKTAIDFTQNEVMPAGCRNRGQELCGDQGAAAQGRRTRADVRGHPEAYGGLEMDKVTSALVAESIRSWPAFRWPSARTWESARCRLSGTAPRSRSGSTCRSSGTGEWIGAYALSESSSASDAMNCRTRAVLSADGKFYVLNGEKMWITNSGFADLFTVFAKVDGEKFSAFLIERNTPGFSIGAEEHKLGIRGSSTCPLILADCQVPVENLLGEVGKGHHIAFNILEHRALQAGCGLRRRGAQRFARTPSGTPRSVRRSASRSRVRD
jgi:butyryl-CoA dehydrogenase